MIVKMRLFFCICLAILQMSCSKKIELEGTIERKAVKKVYLYSYVDGDVNRIAEAAVNDKRHFRFDTLLQAEGIYLIGENEKVLYPIYLKDREKLSVRILNNCLLLDENVGEENRLLYEWENKVVEVREHAFLRDYIPQGRSVSSEEFFKELSELSHWQLEYVQKLKNACNGSFANYLKYKSEVDLNFYALSYLRIQGIKDSLEISQCEYYKRMEPERLFQDERLLKIPYAGEMLISYVWFVGHVLGEEMEGYEIINSNSLKQRYLLTVASSFRFYDDYKKFYNKIDKKILNAAFKDKWQKIEKELAWSMPGGSAPDFRGMKPDGSFLTFSDFKGKVVVVDVWATWCLPCRMMMPYFIQLEKELNTSDVVFISVCMGASIEKESWLEIIKKEHLEGNLCFIDSWTGEFAQNYRITGVPRYMIFDREGKIVSIKAPMPNTQELKEMILRTL